MNLAQKKDWHSAMKVIMEIESKYGSINDAPEDDKLVKVLHKLTGAPKKTVVKNGVIYQPKVTYDPQVMIAYIKKGYSSYDIAATMGVSQTTVIDFAHRRKIPLKPKFGYKVYSSRSDKVYYSTSLFGISKYILDTDYSLNFAYLKAKLRSKGLRLQHSNFRWFQIPDGSYYHHQRIDGFAQKHGEDSYIFKKRMMQEQGY